MKLSLLRDPDYARDIGAVCQKSLHCVAATAAPGRWLRKNPMELAAFISTETGTDLIVSFAVCEPDDPTQVESLTIMRTPKYEGILYEWERGATVSFEREEDEEDGDERALLREFRYDPERKVVTFRSDRRTYEVDVRKVDAKDLKEMRRVLRKMNFDASIKFEGV